MNINRQEKTMVVINDGAKVRPDWTDRIAISSMYITDKGALWYSPLSIPYAGVINEHGDLSAMALSVMAVIRCNRAWEVRNLAGNLVATESFLDFRAKQPGRYYAESWSVGALDPSEVNVYHGRYNGNLATRMEGGVITLKNRDYDVEFEVNPLVLNWNEQRATIDYSHNVVYNQDFGTLLITPDQNLVVNDNTIMHNIDGNETKFYIRELGCYILNTNSDDGVTFADLTSDVTLRKSDVTGIAKVKRPDGIYFVEIKHKKSCELIEMGNVWNKPLWTNDVIGQNIAFNEISEWLI